MRASYRGPPAPPLVGLQMHDEISMTWPCPTTSTSSVPVFGMRFLLKPSYIAIMGPSRACVLRVSDGRS